MRNRLEQFPIHLGRKGVAVAQPEMTGGMAWYEGYDARHGSDGVDGRLVSQYTFTEAWTSWEVHPVGDEVVVCIRGELELIQEIDEKNVVTKLSTGEYAINPAGVWHTMDVHSDVTVLFITAGEGTKHRSRD